MMFRRPLHHRGRTGKQRHRGPFGLSGAAKLSRARDCEKLRVVNLCYARRIHRSRRLRLSTTMVLSGRSVICVWSSCWQLTSPRSPAGRPAPAAVRVARFWQRGWRQALRAAPGVGLGRCGFLAHGVAHCSRWWHRCCGALQPNRDRDGPLSVGRLHPHPAYCPGLRRWPSPWRRRARHGESQSDRPGAQAQRACSNRPVNASR